MNIQKLLKRLLTALCVSVLLFSVVQVSQVKAAIFGVSATNNGNGTITVTISGDCAGGFTVTAGSASANVGKSTIGASASVTLQTGAGTFTVTASAISVTDSNYQLIPDGTTATTTVTVTVPNTGGGGGNTPTTPTTPDGSANGSTAVPEEKPNDGKSSEASLASLKVSKGKLSPEFNENTTSYDLGLTSDITSLEIDAKAKDAKAVVSGSAKHAVKIGKQDINISVTAENGSVKTYVIHVTVEEKPKDFISHSGQKLGVVTNVDDVIAPDGFSKTEVKLSGKKITGWHNATSKISLVYLADKDMVKNFYMVENGKVTSIYKPIMLLGKSLVVIDVPKELQTKKGMKFTAITVDNQKLQGWTFDDKSFANYYLIYIMDTNGKVKYYQYEKTEEILQLYSGAAPISANDYESNDQGSGNNILTYGAIATSVVFLGTLVYISLRNKKNVAYLMTQRRLGYLNQEITPTPQAETPDDLENE